MRDYVAGGGRLRMALWDLGLIPVLTTYRVISSDTSVC